MILTNQKIWQNEYGVYFYITIIFKYILKIDVKVIIAHVGCTINLGNGVVGKKLNIMWQLWYVKIK